MTAINDNISNLVSRTRLRFVDTLRNSQPVWEVCAAAGILRSNFGCDLANKLSLQATAYRRTRIGFMRARLEAQLSPWLSPASVHIWRDQRIGWKRREQSANTTLGKGLILKSPTPGEKGVLYLSFEYNWLRLISQCDVPKLLQNYFLVIASSSSPPDFPAHWALSHIGPDPIFLQISNLGDAKIYPWQNHKITPLPIMASDWVHPGFYEPRPHRQREVDILMVAGWSRVKRHCLLFQALRTMPRNLRVMLIGQDSEGRTADDVWKEAKAFGVADRIELIRDATIEFVTKQQCNSRVSVVLSAREGSSVVTTESFFADTPVAMMHNAHVGSRAYINSETGVLLNRQSMALQLTKLAENSASYHPRKWALNTLTCFHSTSKLNAALREFSIYRGMAWTRDISPLCWRPDPVYAVAADAERFKPAYRALYETHGLAIAEHAPSPVAHNRGVSEATLKGCYLDGAGKPKEVG